MAWHQSHHCAPQIFDHTFLAGQRCTPEQEDVSNMHRLEAFKVTVKLKGNPSLYFRSHAQISRSIRWQRGRDTHYHERLSVRAENTSLSLKVKLKESNAVKSTVVACCFQPHSEALQRGEAACRSRSALCKPIMCWDGQQEVVCINSLLNVTWLSPDILLFGNLVKNKSGI